jgi:hypothetical protein
MTEKFIGAPGCYTPPYLEKLKKFKNGFKKSFFLNQR